MYGMGIHCFEDLKATSGVSELLLVPTQQFFQLYHVENKLIVNEMMMRS